MFTIRYTTENYLGQSFSHSFTEETYEDARQTFNNVCSLLHSEWFNSCYCKVQVTLLDWFEQIDNYSLCDMEN